MQHGDGTRLRIGIVGEQHFYGLGESGQQFDRLGATRRLWNSQANHGAGADIAIPLLVSNAGYALFFDNSSEGADHAGRFRRAHPPRSSIATRTGRSTSTS